MLLGKDLKSGASKSCGHTKSVKALINNQDNRFIDLTGQQFGDWKVIKYRGKNKWECVCSCNKNKIHIVDGRSLKSGTSKSCGHSSGKLKDIKDQIFGELTAREYIGDGYWRCDCSCGNQLNVLGKDLRSGRTKHCKNPVHRYIDIHNNKYGKLTVLGYAGNNKWTCRCDCGNVVDIFSANLRSNGTKSCGCDTSESRLKTMIARGRLPYRSDEQIKALQSQSNIENFLGNKKYTFHELADKLGISYEHLIVNVASKLDLSKFIISNSGKSNAETEIYNFLTSIIDKSKVNTHCREILNNKEIDIYIPDKRIGIEFNGSYWHSQLHKYPKYHQEKSIEA